MTVWARPDPATRAPVEGTPLDESGRSLLEGEYGNMLACIRCGQCLTSCPTYVLTGNEAEGPRGRIAMARALVEGQLPLTPDLVAHEHNCLVCDACTAVCPAGVHMDPLQVALRAAIEPRLAPGGPCFSGRSGASCSARLRPHAPLPAAGAALALPALWPAVGRAALGAAAAAAARGDRGAPAAVLPLASSCRAASVTRRTGDGAERTVALFAGCVMSTALAEIDRATIRVLQRAGWTVSNTAGQGCCGALHAHGGDLDGLRALARRNIAAFEPEGDAPIVVNSAGCGAMLKDYAHHLRDDPAWAERARAFAARVRDVTEFVAGRPALPAHGRGGGHLPGAVPPRPRAAHQPPAAGAAAAIPGLELREMAESALCCGSAGVYNVTNPARPASCSSASSTTPRDRRGGDRHRQPRLLLQLRAGLGERGDAVAVRHIVELLDEATAP